MSSITRRHFMISSTATIGAISLGQFFRSTTDYTADSEVLLYIGQSARNVRAEPGSVLVIWSVDQFGMTRQVPLDFLPHGIISDFRNGDTAILIESMGNRACVVDLIAGSITTRFGPKRGHMFAGHGCHSADGKRLYLTEMHMSNQQGVVTVRDSRTMTIIDELETNSVNPHDCQTLYGSSVIVIANGGGAMGRRESSSLTYVDLTTGELLKKTEWDQQNRGRRKQRYTDTGHLLATQVDDLIVVAGTVIAIEPRDEPPVLLAYQNEALNASRSAEMSAAFHEPSATLALSNPRAEKVEFWCVKTHQCIGSWSAPNLGAITLNSSNTHFITNYGHDEEWLWIAADTLRPERAFKKPVPEVELVGNHIGTRTLSG